MLRGRAHGPVDPPWAAVLEAIGPLLADRPSEELIALLRRDAGPVLRQVPALATLARGLAVPRTSALADPERRQPRALESLLRWLGRRAVDRPIVLALEDLHVADAATRAFATFVARIANEERIALVLSYQPDRLTREHPLRENLSIIDAGLAAAGPRRPRAVHARRDRVAHRGDRGRAPVRLDRGPGLGAVGGLGRGRRGAGGGTAGAPQRVADRHPVGHRGRPARAAVARVPAAAPPAWTRGASSRHRGARDRRRGVRGRWQHPPAAAVQHATPARHRGPRPGPRGRPRRGARARLRPPRARRPGSRSATSSWRAPS